jgi:hypothetical protein
MVIAKSTVRKVANITTFYPRIESTIPHEVQRHLQLIYSKLNNHAMAFGQVASATVGGAATGETLQQIVKGGNQLTINQTLGLPGAGVVNDQTGGFTRAAYTTQQSDSGAMIIVGDPFGVTVTLNSSVSVPWATFISNHGAGLATLVPQTGVIRYANNAGAASMPLLSGFWAMVGFDGTDFWGAAQSGGIGTPVGIVYPYRAVTAAYSIVVSDYQIEATANTFTITLPDATGVAGDAYSIKNSGTGIITVDTTSAQTIDGALTQTLTQWDNLTVMSNGTGWIIT